ncbi:TPA: hypothetical protein SL550_000186 [Pseudomonas aeruginosa]|nr:hypothetical protein [Pseudomonas aeruginosa]HEJ4452832.1 hypothetical protein [Pseudomonas aeruginosa]
MTESKICTCPSGDGSLRWPCPKHPAVEQAGGDERAACNLWIAEQQLCQGSDISLFKLERNGALVSLRDLLRDAYQAGQARAALAQPSPVRSSLLINGYQLRAALDFIAPDGTAEQLESETCIEWRQQDADFLEAGLYAFCAEYPEEGGVLLDEEPTTAQPSPLQSEQAEAERPVVVARLYRSNDLTMTPFAEVQKPLPLPASDGTLTVDALMTVAQHERIVGELRSDRDSWAEQAEQRLADWDEMRKERDAALARVAELEGQSGFEFVYDSDELVAVPRGLLGAACHAIDKKRDAPRTIAKLREYARGLPAPVAQAQQLNDLDKQCRDDVARALGLRPNQERGFAWSYLLASIKSCVKASGDSAQAQHSVPGDIMRDAQRYRWLRDQQFYFSFSTENSDAGISSCTAGMSSRFKNLSWVDAAIDSAIAAAPDKEGV